MTKPLKKILNKGISTPFAILLIVICASLVSGIVFWQYRKDIEKEIKISPSSGLVGAALPASLEEEDISKWEIYRNEEYGFEIKYPPFGVPYITEPGMRSPRGEWGRQIGKLVDFQIGGNPLCQFNGTVYSNPKNLSLKDFWETALSEQYQIKSYEDIVFGKNLTSGIKFLMERPGEEFPNGSMAILTEKNSNIVVLLWWGENLIMPQEECFKAESMLSTFRWTQDNQKELEVETPKKEEVITFQDCVAKGYLEFPPNLESFPRQCETPDGRTFVEELERDATIEQASWRVCSVPYDVNETINFFDCPTWMQSIDWDRAYQDKATLKFYFYNSVDKETQRAYLSKKTGGIAFMVENIIKEDKWTYHGFNSIKFIYPNHEIVTLYTNYINIYHEEMGEIKFSPDGQYISLILHVYDSRRISIIDVNTGRDIILPDYDIYSYLLDEIVWSHDGKYVAIDNEFSGYGADGSESIFVGDMTGDGRLNKIFEVDIEEVLWEDKRTVKLSFDEEDKHIYFSVENPSVETVEGYLIEEVRYKYNISDRELVVIGEYFRR
jgi:WD40 repeat protein